MCQEQHRVFQMFFQCFIEELLEPEFDFNRALAFRATDPSVMVQSADPVGPGNLESFGYQRTRVGLIVAAWGSLAVRYRPRVNWQTTIRKTLEAIGKPVQCLGVNADGEPKHPLYLKSTAERNEWLHR